MAPGRWSQYDEDEYRLPEGMVRVGYDADTGRYHFRDNGGVRYAGAEGAQFGEMVRVSGAMEHDAEDTRTNDLEAAPTRSDGYQPLAIDNNNTYGRNAAYRPLFPFFLIIAVVLLLIWRLILSPAMSSQRGDCPSGSMSYWIRPGDSCWDIANVHGCKVDDLTAANPSVDCDRLLPGTTMCLPGVTTPVPSSSRS